MSSVTLLRASVLLSFGLACRPDPGTSSADAGDLPDRSGDESKIEPDSKAPSGPVRPAGAIFRSELRRATQNGSAAYLLGQLRPEPYRPQGRFEGWIITALWPGDPEFCADGCGLQVGDVILSANGSNFEQPEDLAEAMAGLDSLETIELRGLRDGEYFERTHAIVDP